MSNHITDDERTALVWGLLFGFITGTLITMGGMSAFWKAEAIKHNAGQYNSQTGDFEWINKIEK